jgi:hypothetical protein
VDWVTLGYDRVYWQALVNTVMNLRVPYAAGFDQHEGVQKRQDKAPAAFTSSIQ